MKFIAGLRVWVNGGTGKTPQVFPRIRGSANRRVDLHLPLIASIPCPWRGAMESLADRRRRAEKRAQSLLFPTARPSSNGQKLVLNETAPQWERLQTRSSLHGVNNSRPSPAGARPDSTPLWNQGAPPCSFPPGPPGPRQGWAAGSDRFWLCELRVSQHFSTFYGSSVQSLDTQLGARDRRRTLTIQRGGAQRTLSAGSWFEQGLLARPSTAVNRSRTQSRTTAGLPGRPACVSTRAGFSRCFPIGCRPLFKLFGGDLGADGRRDLEDVLDLIIGQVGVDQLLHRWQKHRAVERLQFGGDLLGERRGRERLLLGCRALLRCPGIGWGSRASPAHASGSGAHHGRQNASLLGLALGQAGAQGLRVGVGGQDLKLADQRVRPRRVRSGRFRGRRAA